jgi:hypothetical protein
VIIRNTFFIFWLILDPSNSHVTTFGDIFQYPSPWSHVRCESFNFTKKHQFLGLFVVKFGSKIVTLHLVGSSPPYSVTPYPQTVMYYLNGLLTFTFYFNRLFHNSVRVVESFVESINNFFQVCTQSFFALPEPCCCFTIILSSFIQL